MLTNKMEIIIKFSSLTKAKILFCSNERTLPMPQPSPPGHDEQRDGDGGVGSQGVQPDVHGQGIHEREQAAHLAGGDLTGEGNSLS